MMLLVDLMEVDINFELNFEGDGVDYWDYTLYASVGDEVEWMQSANKSDLEQLKSNCERILKVLEGF